jgi:outer membrane biosynthesis protein TonB
LLQYGTDASISQVTKEYKPIVVTFKVLPSGKIMNVKIVDSAGNELLASKIRISIKNTILNKFPDYINEKLIDVKFSYFFF